MDDVYLCMPQFIKPCLIHFKGDKIQFFLPHYPSQGYRDGVGASPSCICVKAGKLPANSGLYVSIYGFGNMLMGSAH